MNKGFVATTLYLAYCHGCGDGYEVDEGTMVFASVQEAEKYFTTETDYWRFDGSRLLCDRCDRIEDCGRSGHDFAGDVTCNGCGVAFEAVQP